MLPTTGHWKPVSHSSSTTVIVMWLTDSVRFGWLPHSVLRPRASIHSNARPSLYRQSIRGKISGRWLWSSPATNDKMVVLGSLRTHLTLTQASRSRVDNSTSTQRVWFFCGRLLLNWKTSLLINTQLDYDLWVSLVLSHAEGLLAIWGGRAQSSIVHDEMYLRSRPTQVWSSASQFVLRLITLDSGQRWKGPECRCGWRHL